MVILILLIVILQPFEPTYIIDIIVAVTPSMRRGLFGIVIFFMGSFFTFTKYKRNDKSDGYTPVPKPNELSIPSEISISNHNQEIV